MISPSAPFCFVVSFWCVSFEVRELPKLTKSIVDAATRHEKQSGTLSRHMLLVLAARIPRSHSSDNFIAMGLCQSASKVSSGPKGGNRQRKRIRPVEHRRTECVYAWNGTAYHSRHFPLSHLS
jgi:hypothetical protein